MTTKEAAAALDISDSHVRRLCERGQIKAVKPIGSDAWDVDISGYVKRSTGRPKGSKNKIKPMFTFTQHSRATFRHIEPAISGVFDDFTISNTETSCEFTVAFYRFDKLRGDTAMKLGIFDDALSALKDWPEFFEGIQQFCNATPTPGEFRAFLESLGAVENQEFLHPDHKA